MGCGASTESVVDPNQKPQEIFNKNDTHFSTQISSGFEQPVVQGEQLPASLEGATWIVPKKSEFDIPTLAAIPDRIIDSATYASLFCLASGLCSLKSKNTTISLFIQTKKIDVSVEATLPFRDSLPLSVLPAKFGYAEQAILKHFSIPYSTWHTIADKPLFILQDICTLLSGQACIVLPTKNIQSISRTFTFQELEELIKLGYTIGVVNMKKAVMYKLSLKKDHVHLVPAAQCYNKEKPEAIDLPLKACADIMDAFIILLNLDMSVPENSTMETKSKSNEPWNRSIFSFHSPSKITNNIMQWYKMPQFAFSVPKTFTVITVMTEYIKNLHIHTYPTKFVVPNSESYSTVLPFVSDTNYIATFELPNIMFSKMHTFIAFGDCWKEELLLAVPDAYQDSKLFLHSYKQEISIAKMLTRNDTLLVVDSTSPIASQKANSKFTTFPTASASMKSYLLKIETPSPIKITIITYMIKPVAYMCAIMSDEDIITYGNVSSVQMAVYDELYCEQDTEWKLEIHFFEAPSPYFIYAYIQEASGKLTLSLLT